MYLYLVTLHPMPEATGITVGTGMNSSHSVSFLKPGAVLGTPIRTVPNHQLRADPPVPGAEDVNSHFTRLGALQYDTVIGIQTFWLEESIDPDTIANALAEYYKGLFPKLTFMEGDAYVGGVDTPTSFSVAVDRVEIPSQFTREYVEKEVLRVEVSQLPKLKMVFSPYTSTYADPAFDSARYRVESSLAVPPEPLKTRQRVELFTAQLKAWAASAFAAQAWTRSFSEAQKGDITGASVVAREEDETVCNYSEAFDESTISTRINPPLPAFAVKTLTNAPVAYVFDIPNRQVKVKRGGTMTATLLRLWKGGALEEWHSDSPPLKFERMMFPCDVTPFLGTVFCSEVAVEKIDTETLPVPSSGGVAVLEVGALQKFEVARAEAVATALQKWCTAAKPAAEVKTQATVDATEPVSKFPYEQELDGLWKIFTAEYVQPKGIETSLLGQEILKVPRGSARDAKIHEVSVHWGNHIPIKLFLTAWKIFASQPKASALGRLPHFADTLLGPKPMPIDWSKAITGEILTEWFYNSKGDIFGKAPPVGPPNSKPNVTVIPYSIPFLSRMINMQLFTIFGDLYGREIPSDFTDLTPEEYAAFDGLDYTPILEVMLKQQLSEASKAAWIKAFVRETLTHPVDGSTVGSTEMHTNFLAWVRRTLCRVEQGMKEGMLAQFPIAEFTRLMKTAGFDMTRRSRGMVYLNVAQQSAGAKRPEDMGEAAEKDAKTAKMLMEAEEVITNCLVGSDLPSQPALATAAALLFSASPAKPGSKLFAPPDYAAERDAVYAEQTAQILAGEAAAAAKYSMLLSPDMDKLIEDLGSPGAAAYATLDT
jgi:hypothetical protein